MVDPASSQLLPVIGDFVTAHYFGALGVRPLRGRLLTDDETDIGLAHVVVVSERLWRRVLAADPDLVGRNLTLNGVSFSVVGVAAGFEGWAWHAGNDGRVDVWLPLTSQLQVTGHGSSMSIAVGRLRDASDIRAVDEHIRNAQLQLRDGLSARERLFEPFLESGLWPLNINRSTTATIVTLLTWFVGLVGALACANAASSIVAQLSRRRREMAVRLALGASRWQVSRPLLTDALGLSVAIAAVGAIASGWWLTQLRDLRLSPRLPALSTLAIDWRVLAFSTGAAFLAVTVATVAPLAATLRSDIRRDLWDASRTTGRNRWPHLMLMAVQLAASVALLASALTIGLSLRRLVNADLGIDPQKVIEVSVQPQPFGYTPEKSSAAISRFIGELRHSGFTQVATASPPPLQTMLTRMNVRSDSVPAGRSVGIADVSIDGDYFGVLKLNVLAGRTLADQDQIREGVAPVVVSESLATTLFGGSPSPVGRIFEFDRSGGLASWQAAVIVGIAADVRADARASVYPAIYHRLPPSLAGQTILIRFDGAASPAIRLVEQSAHRADPVAALFRMQTLADDLSLRFSGERALAVVTSVTAPIAIIIAIAGIVTVAAQLMRERRREFAIRAALGASPAVLGRLALKSLIVPILVGTVTGAAVYASLSGLLRSYVFGVEARQTSVLLVAAIIVAGVAILAVFLRTSVAARREPIDALRLE